MLMTLRAQQLLAYCTEKCSCRRACCLFFISGNFVITKRAFARACVTTRFTWHFWNFSTPNRGSGSVFQLMWWKKAKNIPQWSPAALCGCNTLETDKLCYDELTVRHFHSDEMEWFWQCEWCGSQMISCEVMCVSQCCSRELWFFEWWHLYNYNLTALHHSTCGYNGCYHTLTCWSSFH